MERHSQGSGFLIEGHQLEQNGDWPEIHDKTVMRSSGRGKNSEKGAPTERGRAESLRIETGGIFMVFRNGNTDEYSTELCSAAEKETEKES